MFKDSKPWGCESGLTFWKIGANSAWPGRASEETLKVRNLLGC